jgi:uncharacterized iron-regulated membrane protein
MIGLGIAFPLVGLSLLVVWAMDRVVVRMRPAIPST